MLVTNNIFKVILKNMNNEEYFANLSCKNK